jgi:hypothetical protein
MKQFINWLATKNFILVDLMLIASMGVLLYASWPSLQSYSRWTAIALLAIMVVLAVIGLGALVIQVVFLTKKKAVDLRVYEQQQLSLPLSSLHTTKIIEEESKPKFLPSQKSLRKSLPHRPKFHRNISGAQISGEISEGRNISEIVPKVGGEPFHENVTKFQKSGISDDMKVKVSQQIIPSEIKAEIIRLYNRGNGNVAIQKSMGISGENYWMIKTVVDELKRQGGVLR